MIQTSSIEMPLFSLLLRLSKDQIELPKHSDRSWKVFLFVCPIPLLLLTDFRYILSVVFHFLAVFLSLSQSVVLLHLLVIEIYTTLNT